MVKWDESSVKRDRKGRFSRFEAGSIPSLAFMDAAASDAWGAAAFPNDLTPEETQALAAYRTSDGQTTGKQIDSVMARHSTPEDAWTSMAVSPDAFGGKAPDELVGATFEHPGVMSTTMSEMLPDGATGDAPVTLRLSVPAGTPAYYADGLGSAGDDNELILGSGRKFDITGVRETQEGGWEVFGEVRPAVSPRQERFASRGFEPASEDDRKRLSIPPAWTEVLVDRSEGAALLAVGLDAKGREQPIYSSEYHEQQAAAKFARIKELHERLPEIDKRLSGDAKTDDTALAALLIRRMGLRPGSDRDTGAEKKAHGATNLKASHIETDGPTIRARFTGKKGVGLDLSLDDPELAALLEGRKEGKGDEDRLFDTDERKLREYMKTAAPGVKPKDFRTYLGTSTAIGLVEAMPTPENEREYKAQRREVGKQVSELLGNTPTVALQSYIAPSVFGPWDAAMARK